MKVLESDQLVLRGWTDDDVEFVFDLYSRWEVQRFIGRAPRVMADRAEAADLLGYLKSLEDPVRGIWAVQRRNTQQLAGVLLLKSIPASGELTPLQPSGDTEIGWHFHPDHWGHGLATEAASTVLKYAFQSELTKVVAVVHPANTASQRVATRIGMTHQGQTARYYNAMCELYTATSMP